jgi:hypothetical protein
LQRQVKAHYTLSTYKKSPKNMYLFIGLAAIISKTNKLDGCTVAIDGSLFELYPHYANRMRDALRDMLGLSAENVVLEQGTMISSQIYKLFNFYHNYSTRWVWTRCGIDCCACEDASAIGDWNRDLWKRMK